MMLRAVIGIVMLVVGGLLSGVGKAGLASSGKACSWHPPVMRTSRTMKTVLQANRLF